MSSISIAHGASTIYWDVATGDGTSDSLGQWNTSGQTNWTNDPLGLAASTRKTYNSIGGMTGTLDVSFAAGSNSSEQASNVSAIGNLSVFGMIVRDGYLTLTNGGSANIRIGADGVTVGAVSNGNTSATHETSLGSGVVFDMTGSQTWADNGNGDLTIRSTIRNGLSPTGTVTFAANAKGNVNVFGTLANNTGALAVQVNSAGAGKTYFSGTNSYTGGTMLTAGTTVAQNTLAFGAVAGGVSIGAATLDLQTDTSMAAYVTTITDSNAVLTPDVLTAGAGIKHTLGTLTFASGANKLTVLPGSNVTSGTAALTFGATKLASDTTFDIRNSAMASTNVTLGSTTQTNSGTSITKTGSGTLTLTGANGYTGKTNIAAGTLALAQGAKLNNGVGSVVMQGTQPGDATFDVSSAIGPTLSSLSGIGTVKLNLSQTLTIALAGSVNSAGSVDQLAFTGGGVTGGLVLGGNTTFEINALDDGTSQFDSIDLTGQKLFYNNGTLNLVFSGTPTANEQFQIFKFAGFDSAPAQVNISGLTGTATAAYNASTGIVTVSVPEPTGLFLLTAAIPLLTRRRKP